MPAIEGQESSSRRKVAVVYGRGARDFCSRVLARAVRGGVGKQFGCAKWCIAVGAFDS